MRDLNTLRQAAHGLLIIGLAFSVGCAGGTGNDGATGPGGDKSDSGWLASDSYEVGALVEGVVRHAATGEWSELETDEALQAKLVDLQLKFIKTTAERQGWRFNQLADTVEVSDVSVDENGVTITYTAVVDLLGRLNGRLPTLQDIEPRIFMATVPMVPDGFTHSEMSACSVVDGSHSVRDYNFHYYFAPDKEGCTLEMNEALLEITNVFERPTVYPEYDRLLQPLESGGLGFHAALVPNRGDHDPLSRFQAHADMLERDLGLTGVDQDGGLYRRYTWENDGATIIIDLFNPTELPWMGSFASSFREKLGTYTLVHYNGHSSYGSKHLLDEPEAFSDAYQIIMIHSCQSYAYYTRQVFRAKATFQDPSGFGLADVIATGKSSYPNGSPRTLRVLFIALMKGLGASVAGRPENAPTWLEIADDMTRATSGDILYGIAGVRTNQWQP